MNTNETIEYEIPTEEELDVSVQGAERRGYRAGIDKFRDWSDVAFYPGPNENPDFQAGFMEAVHEVGRIAYRLLAEQEKT